MKMIIVTMVRMVVDGDDHERDHPSKGEGRRILFFTITALLIRSLSNAMTCFQMPFWVAVLVPHPVSFREQWMEGGALQRARAYAIRAGTRGGKN